MIGLTEIIATITNKKLTEKQKIKILQSKRISDKLEDYLYSILYNLYIKIEYREEMNILTLMQNGLLEEWCWQTTESAIVFFDDDDYIARGYLYFDEERPKYYHSWICFEYKNKEYVFDPCLNITCKKDLYDKILDTTIKAKIPAKIIKNELINYSNEATENFEKNNPKFDDIMKEILGYRYDDYLESHQDEFSIKPINDDVNTPFYRNNCGYKAKVEDNKVKKLKAHYYIPECI